jgi:iron complex outermembrane recepter protein
VGTKNNLFDGTLQLASSAYWINWKNIQTEVFLATCGADYAVNAGQARSRGADFQADYRIGHALSVGAAGGAGWALTPTGGRDERLRLRTT